VNLVNDVHFIIPVLRRNPDLFIQHPDVIYRIVAGCIQFMDDEGIVVLVAQTGFAGSAGFTICKEGFAVDGFCKNPCTGGFANSSGTTKQKGLGQMPGLYGIFQGLGYVALTHHGIEGGRAVFSG
jgi:hypothetical protein